MITDPAEVRNLRDAYNKVKALEAAAIERGRNWLGLAQPESGPAARQFRNADGYRVKVDTDSLLDEDAEKVIFFHQDEQGRGSWRRVEIPRRFIFGHETEEEKEYAAYVRLHAKYGPLYPR